MDWAEDDMPRHGHHRRICLKASPLVIRQPCQVSKQSTGTTVGPLRGSGEAMGAAVGLGSAGSPTDALC